MVEEKDNWKKVWVVSGDPCLIRFALEAITEGKSIKRHFYKNDDISDLKKILTTYSLIPQKIIIYDPSAEALKLCSEVIEANRLLLEALIVVVWGDNIDGRISFYVKAQKNKRLVNYSYIEANDKQSLLKYISEWQRCSEKEISGEARQWLSNNAPIIYEKIKISGTKKDAEVYDLQLLESELNKILSLCNYEKRNIELNDVVEFCNFDQVVDIWSFIKFIINSDYANSVKILDKMIDQQGTHSILWLLNSQLAFLIQLKQYLNEGITDISVLQKNMSHKEYLNKYYDDNWQEVTGVVDPSINPWRIRKAIESSGNWAIGKLILQYQSVVNAIIDMRSGGQEDIVMPYLLLALCGVVNYDKSLYTE
jgi:DNA polymerase III delta subunit